MHLRTLLSRPRRAVALAVVLGVVGIGTTGALAEPLSPDSRYIVTFAPGVSGEEQAADVAAAGASDVSVIPALRMRAVDASDSAIAALTSSPDVVRVEADHVRDVQAEPTDPEYGNQWSLPRIGWDQAHDSIFPFGSATVAVLDTGVDASHPDLAGQLVPGTSVLDGSDGSADPNGHGTWMAGIVAAATDNGIGIAGVGYAGVRVMPVRVLGADGTGQDSDIIAGVVYAADHGADVILMSFCNPGYSPGACRLRSTTRGPTASSSSPRPATTARRSPTFPAGDRGVVGVSSTDFNDALDRSSNYGAGHVPGRPGRRDRDHGDGRGLRDDQRNVGGGGRGRRRRCAAAGLVVRRLERRHRRPPRAER